MGCGSHPGRSANLQRVHFLSLPIMVPHLSEIGTKLRTKSPACSTIWIARAGVTKYGTVARPAEIWLINLAAVILRTFGAAISAICDFCRHTNARTRLHEQMTTSMLTRLESLWQGVAAGGRSDRAVAGFDPQPCPVEDFCPPMPGPDSSVSLPCWLRSFFLHLHFYFSPADMTSLTASVVAWHSALQPYGRVP